jgi:hypothetical protein
VKRKLKNKARTALELYEGNRRIEQGGYLNEARTALELYEGNRKIEQGGYLNKARTALELYGGNRRIEQGGYLTWHEEERCACGSSVALLGGERKRERESVCVCVCVCVCVWMSGRPILIYSKTCAPHTGGFNTGKTMKSNLLLKQIKTAVNVQQDTHYCSIMLQLGRSG